MTAAEKLKNYTQLNSKVKLAKPSRMYVAQFGKGLLDISGSTMNLLMYLSPFVDLQGKIVIDIEQAKYDLYMQQSTLNLAINEALAHRLLYKKGNDYYSRFHIHTDGKDIDLRYIQILSAYTSKEVLSYSLRTKRLFYYFISSKRMGSWHRIHIENLYKNRLKKDEAGVNYYDTFKEVFNALIELLENGHIEIKLPSQNGLVLKKDTEQLSEKLQTYLGFNLNEKKSRSNCTSRNRVLKIRISSSVTQEVRKVNASFIEIEKMTDKYGIPFDEIKTDSLNYIVSYKNTLFNMMGETGLSIYRNSLQRFLKDHSYDWLHYDQSNKLANYFKDFYLLDEIKQLLLDAAFHQKNCGSRLTQQTKITLCNTYKLDFTQIGSLLGFFVSESSIHHKILLDEELEKLQVKISDLLYNKSDWETIKDTVQQEFTSVWNITFQATGDQYLKSPVELRSFVRDCAKNGLRVKKEHVEKWLGKESLVNPQPLKPVITRKLYNWLVERD